MKFQEVLDSGELVKTYVTQDENTITIRQESISPNRVVHYDSGTIAMSIEMLLTIIKHLLL